MSTLKNLHKSEDSMNEYTKITPQCAGIIFQDIWKEGRKEVA